MLGSEEATAGKSFRNIARVAAIPVGGHRRRGSDRGGVAAISETALPALVERASAALAAAAEEAAA